MNYSKGRKIYIIISAILAVAVAIVIFCLSAQTSTNSANTSGSLIDLIFSVFGRAPNQTVIRTFAHFCEYALFGFLVSNLYFAIKDNSKPFLSILISLGYAITDEIHQLFVPGRAFQLIDLTVDLGGIILGATAFYILHTIINIKKIKHKQTL
ncbi:MAG: VanZ family protein [Acutalibacteraceae bacterium]|nr:VanZ family protein [Acutalibacteraceae bacterium]